ncbi:MAG: glycosyltransferase family 9 protein [Alphaproteobacteria bacterium]|nr:glycosyltransferase family 9 protein [Alphaproteobacteria bacterium]
MTEIARADGSPIRRVLVIKLSALGDIVLALGAFQAIRNAHRGAHITLLTTRPYDTALAPSGWFDAFWIDRRPRLAEPLAWLAFRRRLRGAGLDRVYDLQTSDRTAGYFRLLGPGPRPEWSGIARGASHPDANPDRDRMHTLDRQVEQLAMAGIFDVPAPDLSWVVADATRFALARPYVLLVPGSAGSRPGKRWPAAGYGALARHLRARGVTPVVVGTAVEREAADIICAAAPSAVDLVGRTTLADLVGLARDAAAAVGNDSGPIHLAAVAGAPTVVLFGPESEPALCAPRGAGVTVLQRPRLATLDPAEVAAALNMH